MSRLKNKNIVRKTFNKLKIIKDLGTKGKNYIRYVEVKCDCGKIFKTRYDSVKTGNTKSCGCIRRVKPESGEKYNRMKVIKFTKRKGKYNEIYCLAKCDCGNIKEVNYHSLRTGHTKSCGCLVSENISKAFRKINKIVSNEYLYSIWTHMKTRCKNPNNEKYKYYGGKGIKIYKEWENDYLAFREWAYDNGYEEGQRKKEFKNRLSIDRIDPNDDYKPSNCQFITVSENSSKRHEREGELK